MWRAREGWRGAGSGVRPEHRHRARRGAAVPIMPAGAVEAVLSGDLGFSLSPNGTLLTMPAGFTDTRVVSAGRDGAALALALARGTRARLTAPGAQALFSTWAADGTRVVFSQFGVQSWAAADGSGNAGAIPGATAIDYPSSPGPDADSIIAVGIRPGTAGDVFLLSISGACEPKPLIVTPAYEGGAQLSPDGRWLLYQSDASGQPEIYVRRYPALDRQWQVSEGGGVQARWSRSSREIFYRSGQRMRGSLRPVTDGSGPRAPAQSRRLDEARAAVSAPLAGRPCDTEAMKSVADDLRVRTSEAVLRLPLQARIALALSLGDADLDLYIRTSGLDRATALTRLRAQRSRDRANYSRSADPLR